MKHVLKSAYKSLMTNCIPSIIYDAHIVLQQLVITLRFTTCMLVYYLNIKVSIKDDHPSHLIFHQPYQLYITVYYPLLSNIPNTYLPPPLPTLSYLTNPGYTNTDTGRSRCTLRSMNWIKKQHKKTYQALHCGPLYCIKISAILESMLDCASLQLMTTACSVTIKA